MPLGAVDGEGVVLDGGDEGGVGGGVRELNGGSVPVLAKDGAEGSDPLEDVQRRPDGF